MIQVPLSRAEQLFAKEIGAKRSEPVRAWKAHHVYQEAKGSTPESDARKHLVGAIGEIAALKFLGLPLELITVNTFAKAPDIPPFLQIRSREPSRYPPSLIIRPKDRASEIFLLAFVPSLRLPYLIGWIHAAEVKKPGFSKKDRNGVETFFVPAPRTYPLDPLPDWAEIVQGWSSSYSKLGTSLDRCFDPKEVEAAILHASSLGMGTSRADEIARRIRAEAAPPAPKIIDKELEDLFA